MTRNFPLCHSQQQFVNGHSGNERLRKLAAARKGQFDAGNCSDKRILAMEMVTIIRNLDPPGRFLKKAHSNGTAGAITNHVAAGVVMMEGGWEEVTDEKAIHKACQVMRDMDRTDRKDRQERRGQKNRRPRKDAKHLPAPLHIAVAGADDDPQLDSKSSLATAPPLGAGAGPGAGTEEQEATDSITLLAETLVGESCEKTTTMRRLDLHQRKTNI
jgi:hypothetical protein